jgi:hypothetical protein
MKSLDMLGKQDDNTVDNYWCTLHTDVKSSQGYMENFLFRG